MGFRRAFGVASPGKRIFRGLWSGGGTTLQEPAGAVGGPGTEGPPHAQVIPHSMSQASSARILLRLLRCAHACTCSG